MISKKVSIGKVSNRGGPGRAQVLIQHWRWLQVNGTKQQAASCKQQAASLTRKNYNDIGYYKIKKARKYEQTKNFDKSLALARAARLKLQATSRKLQATSGKLDKKKLQ